MDRNVSHPSYIIFDLSGPWNLSSVEGKVYFKMLNICKTYASVISLYSILFASEKFLTKISIPSSILTCYTYDVMSQVTKVLAWSHVLAFQCQKSEQENIQLDTSSCHAQSILFYCWLFSMVPLQQSWGHGIRSKQNTNK